MHGGTNSMTLTQMRALAVMGVALASTLTLTGTSFAQEGEAPAVLPQYGAAPTQGVDVFHNYYPNSAVGVNSASLYPAPIPTPANVGHTYYTYQPLMPHELLYAHKRVYYTPMPAAGGYYTGSNCDPGYGYNRTTVSWGHHGFSRGTNPFGGFSRLRNGNHGLNGHCGACGVHGCKTCR